MMWLLGILLRLLDWRSRPKPRRAEYRGPADEAEARAMLAAYVRAQERLRRN
jgi:hypothetical protein